MAAERRLSGVGEAYEADVAKKLQLKHHGFLDSRLAGLGVARSAVGRRGEVPVAKSSFAASQQVDDLAVFRDLGQEVAGLGVEHGGAYGHLDDAVFAVLAVGAYGSAAFAVGGEDMALVAQREKRPEMAVSFQYDVAATAAVAAVGTSFRHILGSVEMARAGASLAAAAKDLYVVYKV